MFLAIDIGNTSTVIGIHDGTSWVREQRISSTDALQPGAVWQQFQAALDAMGTASIDGVGIASVVPDRAAIVERMATEHFQRSPLVVSGSLDLGITIHYADPAALGADRLCNAVAGYALLGGPLIVVDCGTSTTFDVVGGTGDFLGGAIMLGIESQAAALHRGTAMLPRIPLAVPQRAVGQDTISAMQAGTLFGAADAIEGLIRRIRREMLSEARVVATGGLSALIAPLCPSISRCEPRLVLDGIRIIYDRVRKD